MSDILLRIRNLTFRVTGVMESKGQSQSGQDQDDTVFIPYTTAQRKLLAISHVPSAMVSATGTCSQSSATMLPSRSSTIASTSGSCRQPRTPSSDARL